MDKGDEYHRYCAAYRLRTHHSLYLEGIPLGLRTLGHLLQHPALVQAEATDQVGDVWAQDCHHEEAGAV